ncbi:LysM peptidoglycan-binding domain-containing protein [Echinicola salinicaeni]|uniref:LysM peptidoglycan-binding domain-containing protein n=1 Tax=Echinicola salinicaeni TaxID=2762757 RepID=UPI001E4997C3|nr:LysM peptidoglycan-binding domain-containing protein [Echinicola salinicaeni]
MLYAQAPRVPSTIQFAGMTLQLNAQAQRDIQLDVDALCRSERFFNMKLERVNLYMPIIERVLNEQGVPNDLKYLVIQESGLIPDAVSTSNAVGFWQFKKGTAHEVFLQVDSQIDERKNIAASTRGAATYLKKHNNYFDNWVCALVSYQMGLGGAKNYFGSKYNGHSTMKITKGTHWYFKKYLAHKVAFENQIGKFTSNQYFKEISVQGPITIKALSKNLGISESELKEYNKWITGNKIPEGKSYSLIYLASGTVPLNPMLTSSTSEKNSNQYSLSAEGFKNASGYPEITGKQLQPFEKNQIKVNGIKGIQAAVNSTIEAFTDKIGMKEGKFRRRNDLSKNDRIQRGQYYYTKRKKSKSNTPHHIVRKGETLWEISQAYGIRLHSLKAKNRIYKDEDLREGMVLNLQKYRGRNEDIRIMPIHPPAQQANASPQRNSTVKPIQQPVRQAKPNPVNSKITHTVSKGETLYAIARKYGVSVSEIQTWNNIQNQTVIKIGQKLIIKKN